MQPIKTALCSFGMSGWVFHAPFVAAHPGFELQGVYERSQKRAQAKYPDVQSYGTLEELLAADNELIVVNTPNDTHYEYAKKALQAGKHVIVEKPFTTTVEEAKELIQLAKQQNKLLSVYHNRRYDSDFRTVAKILHDGWLGDIVEAEIHYDRFKEELSPKLHKEVPGPSTGSLLDLGSHLTDQALQLFGKPDAVFADIRIVRPVSKVDDYFEVLLYYPQLRVRLRGSYQVREPLAAFVVHGSKGSFLKSRADVQEAALQANLPPDSEGWGIEPAEEQGLLHTEREGIVIREKVPTETGNYMEYYNGIYEAIRNHQSPPVAAQDGLYVVQILQAAHQSSREQKLVKFDWAE
ncbi:MAG: Gfo/Idh/MocA family oxidoreductase [Williamsia sp.]|nr:Gfo/Idh/MocA family oxidoreductase [Williamsia sp.]